VHRKNNTVKALTRGGKAILRIKKQREKENGHLSREETIGHTQAGSNSVEK